MNRVFNIMRSGRAGSAMVTLMIIILLVSIGSAAMVGLAKQQAFSGKLTRDYLTAQAYAEAGVCDAYNLLRTNWAARSSSANFPLKSYQTGSYDTDVLGVSSNKALITSTGTCGRSIAVVKMDIQNFNPGGGAGAGSTNPPAAEGAYTYAIVSGGKMDWSGSGTIDVGGAKVHANGQFKMTGSKEVKGNISSCVKIWLTGSTKITGNAAAPVLNYSGGAISGTKTIGAVPSQSIPNIDLTPYYNVALANGQVFSGTKQYSGSSDVAPPGGVVYVNGSLKISGSGRLIGCFIATGDIQNSGSGDQIKVNNYPAFATSGGDLDMSGSGKVHGLMYAKTGGFDRSGSGDVTGSIICGGDFDASGSWSAMAYENSTPVAPSGGGGSGGGGTSGGDRVGVTAWQR